MSGPIIYIALLVVLAAFPAYAGWKFSRKREQFGRMAGTILGGQLIVTPGMALITLTGGTPDGASALRTVLVYAAMALAISIMIFAILEMKNAGSSKP
ncbi:hypothetical protein [Parasphingorhabdus sp.]|uniref:hypothetical protein n=1 Tax=Parasphingorhabdus sp. TaxID=2709688 RepID=UPI002F95D066